MPGLNDIRGTVVPRTNAHVRATIPYDDSSAWVTDARVFLARLRTIRMKQDMCGGSGHYAAGRAALDGLIRLGFEGLIEILHDESPETQANMPRCYEHFGWGGSGFETVGPAGNRVQIVYEPLLRVPPLAVEPGVAQLHRMGYYTGIAETRRLCELRPRMPLGIWGASDGFGMDGEAASALEAERPAPRINTRCAIVLQPFGWRMMKMIEDRDAGVRQAILGLNQSPLASYITEVRDLVGEMPHYQRNPPQITRRIGSYVEASAGNLTANVRATVAATLARTASGGCHLMPVYGLHANCHGPHTLDLLVRSLGELRTMAMLDGPIVIFNILGSYDVTDLGTLALCTHLQADGAGTAAAITAAADGIYIVRAPGLPTALFQQMAAQATLPMLLEGANTAALCLQLGTPFLAVSDNDSIPDIGRYGQGRAILTSLTRFIWGRHPATPPQIAELTSALVESFDPQSDLSRFFREAHRMSRAPDSDQLAVALALLERSVRARGPALVAPAPVPAPPTVLRLRLRPPAPVDGEPTVYTCPRCKKFASLIRRTCWRCDVWLEAGA